MPSNRANMIKCIGLRTNGNEIAMPEGALRQALNVNVDEDGVITPRRGFNDYSNNTNNEINADNTVKQILEYKDKIIRHYQNKLEYEDASGVFQSVDGNFNEVRSGYRIKSQEANSNLYLTTDQGIKKMSVKSSSDFNSAMVSDAGGIKAGFTSGVTVPTVGGILPPQSKVAYRVLFGTKDNNNNLILGYPSSRLVVTNFNKSTITKEISSIKIVINNDIMDGDYVIYENSTGRYTIYFEDPAKNQSEPQTSFTINSTLIRVDIGDTESETAAITANIISNIIPNIDVSIDTGDSTNVIITSTEEGDIVGITNPESYTYLTTSTDLEGAVVEGTDANVRITSVIPNDITTDYFYQVYRTSSISTSVGLELSDIDPGDEANIVFESAVTAADISNGEFVYEDNTPESFRASAASLYTNEVTGEGILQANEAPPIALDIESFRNSVFFANTKSRHRLEFSVLSVDDFISNSTRFIIGNSDITRYYTFVGEAQVQDITINSLPTAGDYIELNSANDERKYYIFFGDTGDDPQVAGAVGYRIKISDTPTTDDVALRIQTALLDNIDFDLSVAASVITFTYTNNGNTTGIVNGVGSSITISAPSTSGDGEDSATEEGGDVLLSGLVSVGQAIDETARSLVKIISKDPLSPVNAYYLSTGEDLPGQVLLENRSLEDKTFYITLQEDSNPVEISKEISPLLPSVTPIESLDIQTTETTITITSHGLSAGDEVFVSFLDDPDSPDNLNDFSGVFTITYIDDDNFEINHVDPVLNGISTTPKYGIIFTPSVESDNQVSPNRVYYSKVNRPEAVPSVNYIPVGAKDEEIKRILALRDNLFILKDDGVYIVSGTSAPNFSVRLLDNTRVIAPDSAVVLNNQIYALTEQGIAIITDSGVGIISRGIEDRIDEVTNISNFSDNVFGVSYENDRAYIMFCPSVDSDTNSTQAYRYNIFEKTWSRWEYDATCGKVLERDNLLYLGNGDRNIISKERKDFERQDHSDRNFTNVINENSVSGDIVKLGFMTDVKPKDVLVQTQQVSINYINYRLLLKMDSFDTGINGPSGASMFDTFKASIGDDLVDKMQSIYDYLITLDVGLKLLDDDDVVIESATFTNGNIKDYTERLVARLNDATTISSKKTYKDPETVTFEAYIISVDTLKNEVKVHQPRPFIEGDIEVYKGYTKTIEWVPQHFGDPSALKQINSVTIMFDQNNFYAGVVKFASDNSQAVKEVEFTGKGIGYWSDMSWGNEDHYWGGVGNDVPFRNPVPREKQRCRYLSLTFEHKSARESFRVIGISGVVRAISDRAYKGI